MKAWLPKAIDLLNASLDPPKHELNELDWKSGLSPDKKRLTEHLSAFANYPGGGFLVYGINPSGKLLGIEESEIPVILTRSDNLGRSGLEPALAIDFAVGDYKIKQTANFLHG